MLRHVSKLSNLKPRHHLGLPVWPTMHVALRSGRDRPAKLKPPGLMTPSFAQRDHEQEVVESFGQVSSSGAGLSIIEGGFNSSDWAHKCCEHPPVAQAQAV